MKYLFPLMLLFASCDKNDYPSKGMLNKVSVEVFDNLLSEYDLNLIRSSSNKGQKITGVVTDYFYDGEVDVMTARFLLHTAVEKYIDEIESNFEMKPFLKDEELNRKNIECTIFFRNGKDMSAVTSVSLLGGFVRYKRYDKHSGATIKIHDEKYK